MLILSLFISFQTSGDDIESLIIKSSGFHPGLLINMPINELPLFILNRRNKHVEDLRIMHQAKNEQTENCELCDPVLRSLSKDFFVVWGFNPMSGCELSYSSGEKDDFSDYGLMGKGGFVDKCSNTVYDLSGRKLSGPDSSPEKLEVPPHEFRDGIFKFRKNIYPEYLVRQKK